MTRHVVVTGSGGMLGADVAAALSRAGYCVTGMARAQADITDRDAVFRFLDAHKPDFVVHTAAMTAVDACEDAVETAMAVNGHAAGFVAAAAAQHNAPIIHISTDYVFDGGKGTPYTEDDPISPLGIYGKSKALGENEAGTNNSKHYILRTSWLFGKNGKNFVRTILGLASQRDELSIVADQMGSPTYTAHLAEAVLKIVNLHFLSDTHHYGIYHISNTGHCSWFDFAQKILELSEIPNVRVQPLSSEEVIRLLNFKAPRPAFSVLDNSKIGMTFGIKLPEWIQALKDYLIISDS